MSREEAVRSQRFWKWIFYACAACGVAGFVGLLYLIRHPTYLQIEAKLTTSDIVVGVVIGLSVAGLVISDLRFEYWRKIEILYSARK